MVIVKAAFFVPSENVWPLEMFRSVPKLELVQGNRNGNRYLLRWGRLTPKTTVAVSICSTTVPHSERYHLMGCETAISMDDIIFFVVADYRRLIHCVS